MHENKFPKAFITAFPQPPVLQQVMNYFHICLIEQKIPPSELEREEGAIYLNKTWMLLNTERLFKKTPEHSQYCFPVPITKNENRLNSVFCCYYNFAISWCDSNFRP